MYPAFNETNKNYQWAIQGNDTHIFSPNTLNEAYFGVDRIEGINPITGLFDVPVVNVTGIGAGYGDGFAQGDFIQHNYHWRDMFTHLVGNHDIQAGFEGLFGDDIRASPAPMISRPSSSITSSIWRGQCLHRNRSRL